MAHPLHQRYVPENDIGKLDGELRNNSQGSITPAGIAQELWKQKLSCGSEYEMQSSKDLFKEQNFPPYFQDSPTLKS